MAQNVIQLQPERTISLPAPAGSPNTSFLVQESMLAANILPYFIVTPFVRIVRANENSLPAGTDLLFTFQTAPLLVSPDDETTKGYRFGTFMDGESGTDIPGFSIRIHPSAAGPSSYADNGGTFFNSGSGGPAMQGLGGLIRWKCTNNTTSSPVTLRFEVLLVCRGF